MNSTLKRVVISSTFATGLFIATPHVAEAALGDQTLRTGMTDSDVKDLQDALKQKGFFTYPQSTGYYGSITADAVRKFQQKHNLQVDGIAGPQTLSKLLAEMDGQVPVVAPVPVKTVTPAPTPVNTTTPSKITQTPASTSKLAATTGLIRVGSRGAHVEELQQKLKELGHFRTSTTDYFGRVTEAAVKEFQKANGLKVDGIVGPQTLSYLMKEALQETTPVYQPEIPVVQEPQPATILKIGSTGAAVTELQAQLRSVGVFHQQPTGYYGEITARSIREFQKIHNLTVDGIASAATVAKLKEVATNKATTPTQSPSSSSGALVTNLLAEAATLIGVPYQWGGTTTAGFDCSGFVQYVFNQQGVSLPRTVALQWNSAQAVSTPAVGDIVFFATINDGPSHNGIYIGNNQFIHSGSSTGVTISSLSNSYWGPRYLGAKRF
ncbi:peptidoglycan-binding protein [Bacillus suaedae]|uniref:C40 family peptidase n=1 Tax=Halalkalibacter suaedae TaxID=2822140 RepID=UPI003211A6BB